MSEEKKGCECSAASKLIFACSGAADVGAVADQAGRKLTRDGVGNMYCLAGIGGRVSGIIKTTEAADTILAIDGCPLDCVKNCLLQAGFKDFHHYRVTDLGFTKGKTPVTEEAISTVVAKGAEVLGCG